MPNENTFDRWIKALQNGDAASPQTVFVSTVSVSFIPSEFHLLLGTTRQIVSYETNAPEARVIEWLQSVVISPTTAKQLSSILQHLVQCYEQMYGAIPMDPGFKIPSVFDQPGESSPVQVSKPFKH